jgi:hypothetical protein
MQSPKGFGPQRPTTPSSVEVYTPPQRKTRLPHPNDKRVVDLNVYRVKPADLTPAEIALRDERIKAAGGFTEEDIAAWQNPTRKMSFACLGTDQPITRWDLLHRPKSDAQAVGCEAAEARKRLGAVIATLEAKRNEALSPSELETLEKGISAHRRILNIYAAFDWACDLIKDISRASMQVARELDAEQLTYIANIKRENKELKEAVANLKSKARAKQAPTIPVMPAPSAEPRSYPELNAMFEAFGADVIRKKLWSGEEYNMFNESCYVEGNHAQDLSVDKLIEEDAFRKHEEESAIDRMYDAAYYRDSSIAEYERLHPLPQALAAAPPRNPDEWDHFDAEQRNRMRAHIEAYLRQRQKAEREIHVATRHGELRMMFDDSVDQGQWEYTARDMEPCLNTATTVFSAQLTWVIKDMIEDGALNRLKPNGHKIIAMVKF